MTYTKIKLTRFIFDRFQVSQAMNWFRKSNISVEHIHQIPNLAHWKIKPRDPAPQQITTSTAIPRFLSTSVVLTTCCILLLHLSAPYLSTLQLYYALSLKISFGDGANFMLLSAPSAWDLQLLLFWASWILSKQVIPGIFSSDCCRSPHIIIRLPYNYQLSSNMSLYSFIFSCHIPLPSSATIYEQPRSPLLRKELTVCFTRKRAYTRWLMTNVQWLMND